MFIKITFEVFHFEISGNDANEFHPANIADIFVTFEIFHFEISGNDANELHPANIVDIRHIRYI